MLRWARSEVRRAKRESERGERHIYLCYYAESSPLTVTAVTRTAGAVHILESHSYSHISFAYSSNYYYKYCSASVFDPLLLVAVSWSTAAAAAAVTLVHLLTTGNTWSTWHTTRSGNIRIICTST